MISIATLIKAAADAAKPVENLRMMEDRTMAEVPSEREQWIANAQREHRERRGTNTLGGAFRNFTRHLGSNIRAAKGGPATLTPPQR